MNDGTTRVLVAVLAALAVHAAIVALRRALGRRLERGSSTVVDRGADVIDGVAGVVADAVAAAGGVGWVVLHVVITRAGRRGQEAVAFVRSGVADPVARRWSPATVGASIPTAPRAVDELVAVLDRVVPPGPYAEPVPALVVRELSARLAPRLASGTVVHLAVGTVDTGFGSAERRATVVSVVATASGVVEATAAHRPLTPAPAAR